MKATPFVLAFALLGAAADGAPPAEREPGGSWTLVQSDGARIVLQAPPESRDGRLVGRLAGTGTLVSIPKARIDEAATRKANSGEPGPPASPAPSRRTPAPFETPPLGDRAKLTRSPGEARRVLESAAVGPQAPAPGPTPKAARPDGAIDASTVAEPPEPKDKDGRGEAYWRERAAAARGALDDAERELASVEAQLREAERSYLGVGEAERNTYVVRVIEARDVAEKARAHHRSAAGRWEALQEEARKAGAFPGWLR